MRPADLEEFGRSYGIEISPVKGGEGLQEEVLGEAFGQLVFVFKRSLNSPPTTRARHFVGLRYAPASSMPGPGGRVSF